MAKNYSDWIKGRIDKHGFQDGVDYTTTAKLPNRGISTGGRRVTEYHISLDMAKELAMVERNEQGKQARLYSIRINAFVP